MLTLCILRMLGKEKEETLVYFKAFSSYYIENNKKKTWLNPSCTFTLDFPWPDSLIYIANMPTLILAAN